ncbi:MULTISPECIES: hypothetical protein [Streptomyces]|uniref:Uncharacterized protein n=1 Tax=Streptomyces glycanivorans TaxID=3033808 RepID=A0ABY9JHP3_9ACTN|nr:MULTISPECIES: hypothetical protein [unclassified Streptomyces]WSQ80673.1 hypothetical protein OG725_27770 [Streptomyces sp. NBC_01213]WLQ67250.1 hypothetical protein P8A20_28355 [Streptomyces sp. Alt3]WSQ88005.1 hypothetical protein OG722_28205 [Streptomyces sp. NBC_01212]WSR05987.1 hypothetical protein OG265_08260 [Streptomyces sp. NBC_01208]WSR51405.1 hypothetical protein OG279_28830 [Streptomyces sp. NBC_01201]
MDEDLRERLRAAAASHHPDRARMLARVERGMAEEPPARPARVPRTAMPWLRVAGATAAVCGVLTAGAFAVASAGGEEPEGGQRVAAGPASPGPTSPAAGRGGALPAGKGPLWSDGSLDPDSNSYWAQSEVTVKTAGPLSTLTVELRIALNGGVNTTGSWRSLPEEDFTVSAREEDGFLVYRWDLKPGRSVPAGTHTFAGQYNHAQGDRDAGRDDYTARARVAGEQVAVGGDFTQTR